MTLSLRQSLYLAAALPALWLASCAHGSTGGKEGQDLTAAPTTGAQSTEQEKAFRIKTGNMGDDDYGKIAEHFGAYNKKYDARGSTAKNAANFDKADPHFTKDFDTKQFQKKSFWGDKEYAKKVYGGNTDGSRFMKDSKFGDKSAKEGGLAAHDADRQFAVHDKTNFGSKVANETSKSNIASKSYAEADHRREVGNAFSDASTIDWKAQRDMSVQQVRSMLGR